MMNGSVQMLNLEKLAVTDLNLRPREHVFGPMAKMRDFKDF